MKRTDMSVTDINKLTEDFIYKFTALQSPLHLSIIEWFETNGTVPCDIENTLIEMFEALKDKGFYVEAFWIAEAAQQFTAMESCSAERLKCSQKQVEERYIEECCKWLEEEIVAPQDKVVSLKFMLGRNLSALLCSNPIICIFLRNANPDRRIKIEKACSEDKNLHYYIKNRDSEKQFADTIYSVDVLRAKIKKDGFPACFIGMGSGHFLLAAFVDLSLLMSTSNTIYYTDGMRIPIYLIEPSISVFKANLAIHDMITIIASEFVFLYLGPEGVEAFFDFFEKEDQTCISEFHLIDPYIVSELTGRLRELSARKEEEYVKNRKKIFHLYSSKTDEEWRTIYKQERPLRVMGYTTLFSTFFKYCMRDMLEGFKTAGCETKMLMERSPVLRMSARDMVKEIAEFEPDLFLGIAHNRWDWGAGIPDNVPFINWQQDRMPHNSSSEAAAKVGKKDLIIAARWNRDWLLEAGFPSDKIKLLDYWPTNTNIYRPVELTKDQLERWGCDVSFISHNSTAPEYELKLLLEATSNGSEVKKLFETYYSVIESRFDKWDNYPVSEQDYSYLLDYASVQRSVYIKEDEIKAKVVFYFFHRIGDRFFRQRSLEELAANGIRLALYGLGWEKHPRLSRFARGVAGNGEELNIVYNASKITYHALQSQTMHNRVMDGMAAKACVLIQRLPKDMDSVERLFTSGEDFVYFNGPYDIVEKVSSLLNSPREREKIARNACQKVQSYTYKTFAQEILDVIAKDPNNIRVRE